MRSQRRLAVFISLAAVVLVSAGCGARLSEKDRALAIQQGGGGTNVTTGGGGTAQTGTGTGTTTTGGTTGGTTGTQGTTGTKGTTGGTTGSQGGLNDKYSCKETPSNNGGKTDTGVTATTINVANISDISGPVPGLFKSAREASQAFVTYFNATYPNGICGRKLVLDTYDSRTDATSNRTATDQACKKDFAITGSQSAFDDGGAGPINSCKMVDIPGSAVTPGRQASPYTHAALSTDVHHISDAGPKYFMGSKFGSGAANVMQHAAFLYIDAGASKDNGEHDIAAYKKAGVKIVYSAAIPIQSATTQGFKPYVQKMKSAGVKFVQWLGAYQMAASLAQAMDQSGFTPGAFLMDPTAYNAAYLQQAGGLADKVHSYVYSPAAPLDANIPEVQLYRQWLQRAGISSEPTFFGQCSWAAMRLFVDTAFKVGAKLTRASMNDLLKKVDNYTGNEMMSKQHVGAKRTGEGVLFLRSQGGKWVKEAPAGNGYIYGKLVST